MNESDSTSNQPEGPRSEPARIASALAAAIDRYGPALFLDHDRLKFLLHQACPDETREITLILAALAEKVPQRMLAAHSDEELQDSLPNLVQELVGNAAFERRSAVWSVKVWAGALALPVTGLVGKTAVAIPPPAYAVNFASVVTPLSSRPLITTPRPGMPSMPDPAPTTPVEPGGVAEPVAPVIEAVEPIVVPSPTVAPVTDGPSRVRPASIPPPPRTRAIVPDARTAKAPPAFVRETPKRGGLSRAGRNALGLGVVIVAAVAIVVVLVRTGSFFSAPAPAASEVRATPMTTPKADAPATSSATAGSAVSTAQAVLPPSATPPVETAAVPPSQAQQAAAAPPPPPPPPQAPASFISSVEVPRLVAGRPFVVGINVSGSQDNVAAIESKVIDNNASKADDAKMTPLADLKRSTDGAWLVPFKAIDAPSRGTLRLALVDTAGRRSASKNVDLQVDASPTAPSSESAVAAAPLPACTRTTCGNVVSIRAVEADSNFEVIVRMDDRTIRAIRESARLPVGARVQQADGRYVVKGRVPAKKATTERNATKAPDIFGSMFSKH
ncbi:MAG: hypothetical protein ABI277_16125 [Burkholderiaceae bacterium]